MGTRLLALVFTFIAVSAAHAATPLPALACSCAAVPLVDMRDDPRHIAFSGEVVSAGGGGVEVRVERWYKGRPTPTVSLDPSDFGVDGGMCQIEQPAIGSRWIWVAGHDPERGRTSINLCTQQAELGTAQGRALEAEVRDAFGEGRPVKAEPAEEEASPVVPGPLSTPGAALVVLGAVGLLVLVLFGGVIILARRGDRSAG